jgi:hypothetical protein
MTRSANTHRPEQRKPPVGIRSALAGEMGGIDDKHRVKFKADGAGLNVANPGQKQRSEPVAVGGATSVASLTERRASPQTTLPYRSIHSPVARNSPDARRGRIGTGNGFSARITMREAWYPARGLSPNFPSMESMTPEGISFQESRARPAGWHRMTLPCAENPGSPRESQGTGGMSGNPS